MSRPPLRLIDGLRERADNADIDRIVIESEARAHVARMRLSLQRTLFDTELFAPVKRSLLNEIEAFARKVEETPERAA